MSYAYNSRKKAIKNGLVPKGKKSVRMGNTKEVKDATLQ